MFSSLDSLATQAMVTSRDALLLLCLSTMFDPRLGTSPTGPRRAGHWVEVLHSPVVACATLTGRLLIFCSGLVSVCHRLMSRACCRQACLLPCQARSWACGSRPEGSLECSLRAPAGGLRPDGFRLWSVCHSAGYSGAPAPMVDWTTRDTCDGDSREVLMHRRASPERVGSLDGRCCVSR